MEVVAFTPIPTLTPDVGPDLSSKSLTLVSAPIEESGASPAYTITAQIPQLAGVNDPRVAQFNLTMNLLIQNEIDRFRADVLANQPVTPIVAGSALDIKYTLVSQRDSVWSFKFDGYVYYDGAAHPISYSITVNYDLLQGRELSFDDLFLSSTNYLQFISDYCKAELATRDIAFETFQIGADPLPENYQRWNLSDDGLLITFDVYQVAAYAAGPQTVLIPYADLRPVSNLNGVLQIYDR